MLCQPKVKINDKLNILLERKECTQLIMFFCDYVIPDPPGYLSIFL